MRTGPQSLLVTLDKAYDLQIRTISMGHSLLNKHKFIDLELVYYWTSTISLLNISNRENS